MAHFAYVVAGVVERVYLLADAVIFGTDEEENEALGQEFLAELHGLNAEDLVQCSYSGSFRGAYPAAGFVYSDVLNCFAPRAPHASWVLDEATCEWVAPIAYPAEGVHVWDEEAGVWLEVTDETV
jgi:hypothetical protein